MIRETLGKASLSAKVSRALLEGQAPDDAVSRAYYSAFNTARALIAFQNPDFTAKSHGSVLGEFNRLFVKTGVLPSDFGALINRAQSARQVADYENDGITVKEAERYVSFAEALLSKAFELIPADEHPTPIARSPQEILTAATAEEAAKRALAKTFCDLASRRNEQIPASLQDELILYGTESDLHDLIISIDEMTDLRSYIKARLPIPTWG